MNWRSWLFGAGLQPSIIEDYRRLWAQPVIRTGCADPRRREAEARVEQRTERVVRVRIQVPWRQA